MDLVPDAGPDKQGQLAPLAKQYRDTLDAIDKLPQARTDTVDDLKKRRARKAAARSTDPEVSTRPARKVVGGTS